jgi:cytochrome b pre-mRNA-processing protein 3
MLSAHPYRTAAPPPPSTRRGARDDAPPSSRRERLLVMTLVGLAGWTAFIGWREHRLDAAVASMPAAVQQAAFRRVHDDLSTTCVIQPRLADHCQAQAEFILRFPQCDDDCQELARRFLPMARR